MYSWTKETLQHTGFPAAATPLPPRAAPPSKASATRPILLLSRTPPAPSPPRVVETDRDRHSARAFSSRARLPHARAVWPVPAPPRLPRRTSDSRLTLRLTF